MALTISQLYRKAAEKPEKKQLMQEISDLVAIGLELSGKSQYWLSRQIRVSRQTINDFVHERCWPSDYSRKKMEMALISAMEDRLSSMSAAYRAVLEQKAGLYDIVFKPQGFHSSLRSG